MGLDRLDDLVGQAVEDRVRNHHRRRLERLGQTARLEPPADGSLWAAGEPLPREGCDLDVLIDGEEALAAIASALSAARSHVHIAGWHLAPGFGLLRDQPAPRLRDLLAALAERLNVRVLLWAGAPLPVFTPSRSEVRDAARELTRGTAISCALDSRERPMHCHHEKLVIVDDEVAFVGGIDLTTLGGDRFDTPEHPMRSRLGWHDACVRLRGPVVGDVAEHFAARWRESSGEQLASPPRAPAAGGAPARTVQVVRTVPERIYDFSPRGRVQDPRGLQAGTALRTAADLPREPVPLVAAHRRDPGGEAARPSGPALPRHRAPARETQQRRRLHPRPARCARRGRRRQRTASWPRRSPRAAAR